MVEFCYGATVVSEAEFTHDRGPPFRCDAATSTRWQHFQDWAPVRCIT
jgi:hypothetical protein